MPDFKPGLYQHFKGSEYFVYSTAQHTESSEWLVIYSSANEPFKYYPRPAEMFYENTQHNGIDVPRFQFVRSFTRAELNYLYR